MRIQFLLCPDRSVCILIKTEKFSDNCETFRDNCDKNIVQQASCELLFPDVQMQIKRYFFVPFVRPCMHHKYGERVLVVMTHRVQCNIPTFEALLILLT